MIGGISGWQLLILLLIVVLVFGTKRLRNIGSDFGSAVKGFRKGMEDENETEDPGQISSELPPSNAKEDSDKKEEPSAGPSGKDV